MMPKQIITYIMHVSEEQMMQSRDPQGRTLSDQRVVPRQSPSLSINDYPVSSDQRPAVSWERQRVPLALSTWVNNSKERECRVCLLHHMCGRVCAKLHGCLYSDLTTIYVWICWEGPVECTWCTSMEVSLLNSKYATILFFMPTRWGHSDIDMQYAWKKTLVGSCQPSHKEHNNVMANIILQSKQIRKTLSKYPKPVSGMHLSLFSINILNREQGNQRTTAPFNSYDLDIPSLNLFWNGP